MARVDASTSVTAADVLHLINAKYSLAQRHIQLINLVSWIRSDGSSPALSVQRVIEMLDVLDDNDDLRERFKSYWQLLAETIDITTLLADLGFASHPAFLSELVHRISQRILPATPETSDASELFELAIHHPADAAWIIALDEVTLERIYTLMNLPSSESSLSMWQHEILDAITYCAGRVRSIGFAPEVRLRMDAPGLKTRPFHSIAADADLFRSVYMATPYDAKRADEYAQNLRNRLELCRQVTSEVTTHLQEHGISVGLVFKLREMRKRIIRIRELIDCLLSQKPLISSQKLLSRLAVISVEQRSVRALLKDNSSLLASKIAERSAEVGEHYITRDAPAYTTMLGKAAGGGAIMSITTLVKCVLLSLSMSIFWEGLAASINYAVTFLAIQLLHWTVATKQPAMTAPAMAAKLKNIDTDSAIHEFVDEVTHLVRSQVAAVVGNLALVVPCVMGLSAFVQNFIGAPVLNSKEAIYVLQSLTLLGPTAIFAAFTGLLLFSSSMVAGWFENWFVLHRLGSAIRYNPRITQFLGRERAVRWSRFWRTNISGFASNVSLGLMLGLIPAFATFFGLGIEVRHVTLSTGQLTAAAVSLGLGVLNETAFWWCVAAIPLTGLLNIAVSFYCAFRVALSAHNINNIDRARIRFAVWQRFKARPLDYFLPTRNSLAAQTL